MKRILTLSIFLTTVIILSAQEKVYFSSFETINVNKKYQLVCSKLFANYTRDHGKYEIVLPQNLTQNISYSESFEETRQEAKRLELSYFITSDMSAIGNLLIVNMRMYETETGREIWSDAVKANNLEDLDPTIRLLAESLGSDTPAAEKSNIYNITSLESKQLKKKTASDSWGMTLGGGGIFSSDIDQYGVSGFGILRSFDMREFILDLKGEIYLGSNNLNSTRIGMNILKPVNQSDQSMFYGGGLFYGSTNYDRTVRTETTSFIQGINNSGLELEANIGLILNRTSSIQLRAMASPFINFYQIDDNTIGGIRLGIIANF